ncbi:MAG: hypothetical protein ABL904_14630 [Hyphomicrobiaceae bacterium]
MPILLRAIGRFLPALPITFGPILLADTATLQGVVCFILNVVLELRLAPRRKAGASSSSLWYVLLFLLCHGWLGNHRDRSQRYYHYRSHFQFLL